MHYFFLKRNIYFKFEYFLIVQVKLQAQVESLTWCQVKLQVENVDLNLSLTLKSKTWTWRQDKLQALLLRLDLIFSSQVLDTFQALDLSRSVYSEICRRERASIMQKNAIFLHISIVLIILLHLDSNASFSKKSFSSFSSSSSQIAVHSHDCRVLYKLNAFTNKSSRSRILSIDERKRSNEFIVSKRSWKRTKNNVTSVHRIQHASNSTSDRTNIELTSLSYHIEC